MTLRTGFLLVMCAVALMGCQRGPGGVVNKVLVDFGVREQPEGYVSESDKVFQRLGEVGNTELKRLNIEQRQGEIKFQEEGLRGLYYKEVKVYEACYPLDAQPNTRAADGNQAYTGYIEYAYRVYQSPKKPTRAAAAAESATIPTDIEGREAYRYGFGSGGVWDGRKGERVRK
jgi:hypothetical protein